MSNVLTVGMATYGDSCGAYFTITGIRANHPDCDLIVVDNAPIPDLRTRDACLANGGRYHHKPNLHGTSAPRDEVFRLSQTPWTMCVDSHVIFETDAIHGLILHINRKWNSSDIISGPLIQDNGEAWTHCRPTHPPAWWGTWMDAWIHLESRIAFDALQVGAKRLPVKLFEKGPNLPESLTNADIPDHGYKDTLRAFGCIPAAEQHDPFEIHSMGLGVFAMRTEAWPGFNPLFNGFGGEEGYIHELVRRKGGKAICLPALRWRHWFRDGVSPVPYPHHHEHFLWNLLVSHRELGVEALPQIKAHADTGARVTQEHFDRMVRGVEKCVPFNEPGWRPAPLKVLGIWYSNNAAPHKVLKASLDSIKRAQELSRADVKVVTCPHDHIDGNPFPEVLAEFKTGPGHLNIVRQQRQCVEFLDKATTTGTYPEWTVPDVVCFLEHDVLYPPDYFDRVARAFRENPDAPVVSNLDYEGLNETGWLKVKERHEPLFALSMRYDFMVENLARCEADCLAQGWCLLEPQGDRHDWVRIPPTGRMPMIHINWT